MLQSIPKDRKPFVAKSQRLTEGKVSIRYLAFLDIDPKTDNCPQVLTFRVSYAGS
jgi:hypothetical protein